MDGSDGAGANRPSDVEAIEEAEERSPDANPVETDEVVPAPVDRLKIEVDHMVDVTYALAYNKCPIVRRLTITNVAGGLSGPLTVRAAIRWSASTASPTLPFELVVDLPVVGGSVVVEPIELRLDDTVMVDVTETTAARLEFTFNDAAGVEQAWSADVAVHARNQWLVDPALAQITAAFVQPNHPSVNEVLAKAGAILESQGRDRALSGYQSGDPEAIRAIGAAVFLGLQSFVDQYINPPAGYTELGQKLRPIDEVLTTRQGTCIDLACAYASCLEQAGLHPLIFLVHNHAFTGFFLKGSAGLPASVIHDFSTAVSLIESGLVVAAETTFLAEGDSFESAEHAIRSHFTERSAECKRCTSLIAQGKPIGEWAHLESIVDVRTSHAEGILPLPVRFERDGVITIIIDPGPSQPVVIERRDSTTRKLLPQTLPARVQQWKNDLLDLTFKNSLLKFNPTRSGAEIVVAKGLLGAIEDHLSEGKLVGVVPHDQLNAALTAGGFRFARDLNQDGLVEYWRANNALFAGIDAERFDTRIRALASRAKVEEQDTGSNNLFLTLGSLKWTDPRSTVGEVRSPIFMIPIRVKMKRGRDSAEIFADPNGFTTINYCLIEALRAKMKMTLQWFSDDMSDAFGLNIDAGLQAMRQEILEKGLTASGFEVIEDANIGFLRFSKVRLWKDLDEHWEKFAANSVVAHLVDGGRSAYVDPADPEGLGVPVPRDYELLNPQAADGPQALAVRRALAGHSFVLEGPPGTGKSQTITNLLAAALASGKKVLFVAEKQAALQVVHERLSAVGLDPFCLELHDKGAKPERIKEQLRAALDFRPSVDEDEWARLSAKFETETQYLDTYRDKLHGANDAGMSYYEAYIRLLKLGAGPTATCTRRIVEVDAARIADYRRVLDRMEDASQPARPRPRHPWGLAGPLDFGSIDRAGLGTIITSLSAANAALGAGDPWSGILGRASTVDEADGILALARLQVEGISPTIDQWRSVTQAEWASTMRSLLARLVSKFDALTQMTVGIGREGLRHDYSAIRAAVAAALDSFVLGRRGRVSTALATLSTIAPFSTTPPEQLLAVLDELIAGSTEVRSIIAELVSVGSGVVPADWFPSDPQQITVITERVERAAVAGAFLASGGSLSSDAIGVATGLAVASPESIERFEVWRTGLDDLFAMVGSDAESVAFWQGEQSLSGAIGDSVDTWTQDVESGAFRNLQRWLEFTSAVARIDDASLTAFRDELRSGIIGGAEARDAFERALMMATLTEVGEERDLDVFEHTTHNRRITEFMSDLEARQRILRHVIPKMLADGRNFDSSASVGQVGSLRQELGSKRRGARSIRALLSTYPQLITSLTPCFLMSPDSVANFIEPGTIEFDLVVFDEASQITVSSAVGVLGRAKSAVIVGDSKQMPPTTFGASSGSGEEDEFDDRLAENEVAVIADAESILDECVESRMDRAWLAWHYRSEDEVLIQFSNDRYYEKRLASFPGAQVVIPGCGIDYRRVDGQFDHGGKRVNHVEADAIVAEVIRHLADPAERDRSIGIVTMNAEQRNLIIEKLRATGNPAIEEALDPSSDGDEDHEALFVLNLESVQGRERDVIILGTSFSKREGGGKMPLNFGPLTTKGGERRLNVAVTRARRKVIVVTSFDPSELAGANSLGMVHLREYLEMARAVSSGQRSETVRPVDEGHNLHQQAIVDALVDRKLVVSPNVGLSSFRVDIAVSVPESPDRWLVGILLDGPSWAERLLASDRDSLPVVVLERKMGWRKVVRVWLPSWRSDPVGVIDEIEDLVRRLAAEPEPEPEVPTISEPEIGQGVDVGTKAVAPTGVAPIIESDPSEDRSSAPASPDAPSPLVTARFDSERREFVVLPRPAVIGTLEDLERNAGLGTDFVRSMVDEFGPMPKAQAIKVTLNAYGLSQVREERLRQFSHLVDPSTVVSTEFGDFVFPSGMVRDGLVDQSFTWWRASRFSERTFEEIAPHEIANCAVVIVNRGFSISEDELVDELFREFGYARRSEETKSLVRRLVRWVVGAGRLVDDGDQLRVPS